MKFILSGLLAVAIIVAGTGCDGGDPSSDGVPITRETAKQANDATSATSTVATPRPNASATAAFLAEQGLAGKVALIEFGTLGCELSESGLLTIAELRKDDAIAELNYLRVEAARDAKAVEAYFAEKAPGFPIHHDPSRTVAKAFDATTYPCFVLVGKFGHVRYSGKYPAENIDEWTEALAAEKRDPGPEPPPLGAADLDPPKLLAATKLPDLSGDVKPLADYVGDGGILLVFVDTHCPFSNTAITDMPSASETLAGLRIASVLVNIDESAARVKGYFASRDLVTPLVYDDTASTKLAWDIHSVPTLVYINAAGKIAYKGKALWAELAKTLPASSVAPPAFEVKGTGSG